MPPAEICFWFASNQGPSLPLMSRCILVVEDDLPVSDAASYALQRDGYEARVAATGQRALEIVAEDLPALALVDIGLPDMSGWELGRKLIKKDLPVVFMTSRGDESDRVAGLEMGGDDYIVKPFSPREMVARIRAVLRRSERSGAGKAATDPSGLILNDETCRAELMGTELELSRNEFRLLQTLASSPGRVFSRSQLLQNAWEDPFSSQERTVDAHVKQLRAKLRAVDPDYDPIETRRGFGYAFSSEK